MIKQPKNKYEAERMARKIKREERNRREPNARS